MNMQMNIAREPKEYSINQEATNSIKGNTEQLRNEIIYAKTIIAANFFNAGKTDDAHQMASDVLAIADPIGSPLHRLSRILMKGIKNSCYSHTEYPGTLTDLCTGNLYSDQTKSISMIKAYDLLASATPFIQFAYNAVNLAILSESAQSNTLHIIDIGIGSGYQWSTLFSLLKGTSFLPKKIRITGIDIPSARHALNAVEKRLSNEAKELGIEFSFTPFLGKAEEISFNDIQFDRSEFLVINAVLSLHHTATDDAIVNPAHSRDCLLSRLRQLNPNLLTLVEPDSNHNNLPFKEHCNEAFQHYSHIFNVFDYLFPRNLKERALLENEFFGRELVNILTSEGIDRVERHERKEMWSKRLRQADFTYVEDIFQITSRTLKNIVPIATPFEIYQSRHGLCLNVYNVPLLSASCWRPARHERT
ncbi:GRAS family protein [Undibacterium sp. SXout11W]|uniref:GRAS family protein n=1 Tax=Undibacterium sp. SXout11W TaxID=3413050 RepID=UPI003BF2B634